MFFSLFFFACTKKKQKSAPGNPRFLAGQGYTAHCREIFQSAVVQSGEGLQCLDSSDRYPHHNISKNFEVVGQPLSYTVEKL
jgi:hypothetical protein